MVHTQAVSLFKKTIPLSLVFSTLFLHYSVSAAGLQAHGRAAVVSEFVSDAPPSLEHIQGFRVPFGLTFEARPSDTLSLYLDIESAYNNYPRNAQELGNTSTESTSKNSDGSEVQQPLLTYRNKGQTSGQKMEQPKIGFAYMQWSSDIALFRAGRMPRHWGLGIWKNAEWVPEGGSITTSDAISATVDFSPTFSGSIYWEKMSEGSIASKQDDADAFSVEALIADELSDASSSGISKKVGVAFTNYDHKKSSTRFLIVDLFSEIYSGSFLGGGEIFFPSGKTQSPSYEELGGGRACSLLQNRSDIAAEDSYLTCDSESFSGFAALAKMSWQVGGTAKEPDRGFSMAATQSARNRLPTSLRNESHILGISYGYSSGDKDAYNYNPALKITENSDTPSSSITAVPLHPNVAPSFLMFSRSMTPLAGFPGERLMNVWFMKADYVFEAPSFGLISPSFTWAMLNVQNSTPDKVTDASGNLIDNPAAVGVESRHLGLEFDLKYSYLTVDQVQLGLEGGLWFPGKAYHTEQYGTPMTVFGLRAVASTKF